MKDELLKFFKTGAKDPKITVLGVGSEIKSDDGAGHYAAGRLAAKNKKNENKNIQVLSSGTAPENYTSDIKRFETTHLIIIDAAETGKKPGTITLIPRKDIAGVTFSTHVLPLSVMLDYLSQSIEFETLVIGIEPEKLSFGQELTKNVDDAVNKIVSAIIETTGGK
ncbi:MAG: hydrogenase maturation peptidase HycI [Pseudomonadota bacterium]